MSKNTDFEEELLKFCEYNHSLLAKIFRMRPSEISPLAQSVCLNYACGNQLKELYRSLGQLDSPITMGLIRLARENLTLEAVEKSVLRAEMSHIYNKKLDLVYLKNSDYGSKINSIVSCARSVAMRASFKKLISNSAKIEQNTRSLLLNLAEYKNNPNVINKLRVKVSIKKINNSLISSHKLARASCAWALRAGFDRIGISKTISKVYLSRLDRVSSSLTRLDEHLKIFGFNSRMGDGVLVRKKLLSQELMRFNANDDVLRKTNGVRDYAREI